MTRSMRLLENPSVYRLWQMPFAEAKFAPVRRHGEPPPQDACSTSAAAPERMRDSSRRPTTSDSTSTRSTSTRQGDASGTSSSSQTSRETNSPKRTPFDFVLINSLLHHLDTHDVRKLLAAVERHLDTDGHVHILDLVQPTRRGIARLLARLDRGDFPRPLVEWETLFSEAFEPVVLEPYPLPRWPALWNMVYFKGRARR